MQANTYAMDAIRRAFDEACEELAIEPRRLTLAKRDQLVRKVLARLEDVALADRSCRAQGLRLPAVVRLA